MVLLPISIVEYRTSLKWGKSATNLSVIKVDENYVFPAFENEIDLWLVVGRPLCSKIVDLHK